ncbi:MAG: T9SS type A sorting domain-containing protein, partial [Flavobacteriales bacterium]
GGITGGTSPYTLQWNPGGMGGTTINNLVEGTYTLSVTDNNACVKIDTFVVNQPNVLLVTISQNGATLTATVSGGILGYTYRWKEVSSSSVLQGSSTYMVLNYGTYYCEIEDANGCITTSNEFIYSPTSVDFTDLDLSIYPNPFRDRTTVDFGRTIMDGEVKVIDILGNIVEIYELDNQRELVIERTTKSTGIYFVEITINNNKIFKKITLQ